jgi:hypothetical protein
MRITTKKKMTMIVNNKSSNRRITMMIILPTVMTTTISIQVQTMTFEDAVAPFLSPSLLLSLWD